MNGTVQGLVASSIHGFHIHEYGDLRNGCLSTGAHFNPAKVTYQVLLILYLLTYTFTYLG